MSVRIMQEDFEELLKLREEKKTWLKICAWEKAKYMKWQEMFKVTKTFDDLDEHLANINKLLEK